MTPSPRRIRRSDALPEAQEDPADANHRQDGGRRSAPRVRVGYDEPEPDDGLAPYDEGLDETPPWAEKLVRFLDDGIRVPGTDFRFGADAIIGFLFPAIGDVATGVSSISLLFLALKERVPTIVLGKMVLNILIDTLFGSIPFAGDVFDLFFKANRKNLDLIEKYRDDPDARPSTLDYVLVLGGIAIALFGIALPFLIIWAVSGLFGG